MLSACAEILAQQAISNRLLGVSGMLCGRPFGVYARKSPIISNCSQLIFCARRAFAAAFAPARIIDVLV